MTPDEENASLRAENAALREQVATLLAEVQQLWDQLAKDSHTSSKPPASDGLARKTKSLRTPSGKKPGGQPGHRGHHVRLVATPDAVEVHRPTRCGGCQQVLPDEAPCWIERRQVHELPPVRLPVTEHRIAHVCCPACGATTAADAPAGVSAPRQYSPRLRAVATYLVEQQFVRMPARVTCSPRSSASRSRSGRWFAWCATALSGCSQWPTRSHGRCARRRCCTTMRRARVWQGRRALDCSGPMSRAPRT